MNRRRRSLAGVALLAGLAAGALVAPAAPAAEWDASSPVATIVSLQQGLIGAAREHAGVDERYRALEPLVAATHDLPYIAEFALRRQWATLADADRQRFVAAFQRLSVMTYAARFAKVGPESFRAVGAPAAPDASGRVLVGTAIARAGQPDVPLEYLLQRSGADWRIVNIVADGVSDLALKRAEYQRVFAAGALEGLLAELERQTEQLRRD